MSYAIYRPREKPFLVWLGAPLLMVHAVLSLLFIVVTRGSAMQVSVAGYSISPLADWLYWSPFAAGLAVVQFWAGGELLVGTARARRLVLAWLIAGTVGSCIGVAVLGGVARAARLVLMPGFAATVLVYFYLYEYGPSKRYFAMLERRSPAP